MAIIMVLTLVGVSACGGGSEEAADSGGDEQGERMEAGEQAGGEEGGEHGEGGEGGEGGEHVEGDEHAEGDEHGEGGEGGEGEEGGEYIARADTWDATRRGVRLTLAFDEESGSFVGAAENTTEGTICAVRVEVHLAGGPELGPTERRDLGPGESTAVELSAGGEDFESWTAHTETSACGDR